MPFHRRTMPGDRDRGVECIELSDGCSRILPVGGEVSRRSIHLLFLDQHFIKLVGPNSYEGVACNQCFIVITEKRNMSRRMSGSVDPSPSRETRNAAVG